MRKIGLQAVSYGQPDPPGFLVPKWKTYKNMIKSILCSVLIGIFSGILASTQSFSYACVMLNLKYSGLHHADTTLMSVSWLVINVLSFILLSMGLYALVLFCYLVKQLVHWIEVKSSVGLLYVKIRIINSSYRCYSIDSKIFYIK